MNRLNLSMGMLFLTAMASACASSAPTEPGSGEIVGLSISGTPAAAVGGTTQLQAVAVASDGTAQTVTDRAEWVSNTPSVAAVSTGLVSGFAAGDAVVVASYGGRTAQVLVNVSATPTPGGAVTALTITGTPILAVGQTTQLEVLAQVSDGSTRTVTNEATWTSSLPSVASVTDGRVIGLGEGETTVTVEYGGRTAQIAVTVTGTASGVVSLQITGETTLVIGQSVQLVLTAQLTDGSSVIVSADATWRSSDNAAVTVAAGRVTGMSRGSSTVTATYGGRTAQITVVVTG